jgi:hypothetical protein
MLAQSPGQLCRWMLLTLLVLAMLLIVAIRPYYKRGKKFFYSQMMSLTEGKDLVKSGDLVLFRARSSHWVMRTACSGSFTHVGIVFRRTPTSEPEILETDVHRGMIRNNFVQRVQWYQRNVGEVCIRTLNEAITLSQQSTYDNFISPLPWIQHNNDDTWCYYRHPALRRNNFQTNKRLAAQCAKKYLLKRPVNITQTRIEDSICTDSVAHILVKLQILAPQKCYACLKPSFFESTSLNKFVTPRSPWRYNNEIIWLR